MSYQQFFGSWEAVRDGKWREMIPSMKKKNRDDSTKSEAAAELPEPGTYIAQEDADFFKSLDKKTQDWICKAQAEASLIALEVGREQHESLQASNAKLTKQNGDLLACLDKATAALDRLERSYGMSAARNIAMTPLGSGSRSLIETYNDMPEGPEKAAFYKANQAHLLPFINKPKSAL